MTSMTSICTRFRAWERPQVRRWGLNEAHTQRHVEPEVLTNSRDMHEGYIVEIEHIRPKNKTPLAALSSFVFGPNMLYF